MDASDRPGASPLAATSWAILAILSYEEELSGYDIKKVTGRSIRYFYWSPSFSQIYTELKKLERLGLVTSRLDHDNTARSRRLYKITGKGLEAVRGWATGAPADPPVLKHSVLLRVAFGHLTDAARLKELLREHVAFAEKMERDAARDAHGAEALDAWAYPRLAIRWAARYYAAERELALEMIKDLDEAEELYLRSGGAAGFPRPGAAPWPEAADRVAVDGRDDPAPA
ncbi:MAG: helix-turn-helix transcriptional regulator [Actinobacteria bacterium]|nr:helix-turn-helix transcriptional regulator [Actinomycetota bacterium]